MIKLVIEDTYISPFEGERAKKFNSNLHLDISLQITQHLLNYSLELQLKVVMCNDLFGEKMVFEKEYYYIDSVLRKNIINAINRNGISVNHIEKAIFETASNLELDKYNRLKDFVSGNTDHCVKIDSEFVCALNGWNERSESINGINYRFFYEPKVDGVVFGVWESDEEGFYCVDESVALNLNLLEKFIKGE